MYAHRPLWSFIPGWSCKAGISDTTAHRLPHGRLRWKAKGELITNLDNLWLAISKGVWLTHVACKWWSIACIADFTVCILISFKVLRSYILEWKFSVVLYINQKRCVILLKQVVLLVSWARLLSNKFDCYLGNFHQEDILCPIDQLKHCIIKYFCESPLDLINSYCLPIPHAGWQIPVPAVHGSGAVSWCSQDSHPHCQEGPSCRELLQCTWCSLLHALM